jgi:catechol 2,3-dioxygenase-like lactoylglutathione lyase family enzyme
MHLNLSYIGQIALGVSDVDRSEQFYETVLGLRKLFHFGDLTFFDCAGVRLLLEKARDGASAATNSSTIYLRCADIAVAVKELRGPGLAFDGEPHRIARMDDHDLWMAFFRDPDGHSLALMQEAPRGYVPAGAN